MRFMLGLLISMIVANSVEAAPSREAIRSVTSKLQQLPPHYDGPPAYPFTGSVDVPLIGRADLWTDVHRRSLNINLFTFAESEYGNWCKISIRDTRGLGTSFKYREGCQLPRIEQRAEFLALLTKLRIRFGSNRAAQAKYLYTKVVEAALKNLRFPWKEQEL